MNGDPEMTINRDIPDLLRMGNLAQADILLRETLTTEPDNAAAWNDLGRVAAAVGQDAMARACLRQAVVRMPGWAIPRINLAEIERRLTAAAVPPPHATAAERFLLIRAWGYGFWSDVSHVLGQALLADMTGRTPVVHWGANSLFGEKARDGERSGNAFPLYFEPLSPVAPADLVRSDCDIWPPKWTCRTLLGPDIDKWSGPYSRVAGLYALSRPERVVVSDFFTPIRDLRPWIVPGHPLYGLSVDALWRDLIRRYLRPRQDILRAVEAIRQDLIGGRHFIAVHARGSDKALESTSFEALHADYRRAIDQQRARHPEAPIFLMTDDARLVDIFRQWYGSKMVTNACLRTANDLGIHYHDDTDRQRLGTEVLIDVLLAARAVAFVGNGHSNPSLFVHAWKDWSDTDVTLLDGNMAHEANVLLHNW